MATVRQNETGGSESQIAQSRPFKGQEIAMSSPRFTAKRSLYQTNGNYYAAVSPVLAQGPILQELSLCRGRVSRDSSAVIRRVTWTKQAPV